jgi:hypothetical protein
LNTTKILSVRANYNCTWILVYCTDFLLSLNISNWPLRGKKN